MFPGFHLPRATHLAMVLATTMPGRGSLASYTPVPGLSPLLHRGRGLDLQQDPPALCSSPGFLRMESLKLILLGPVTRAPRGSLLHRAALSEKRKSQSHYSGFFLRATGQLEKACGDPQILFSLPSSDITLN